MAYQVTGKMMRSKYINEPRIGDHICYYSDLRKIKADYFLEIAEAKQT